MPSSLYVVAVIDDDDFVREALYGVLVTIDCKVELYASADAFLAAPTTLADCLMVDVHLGTTSGLALGRLLVQAGICLPIIYMSGSGDESIRHQAQDAGCVAFLRKPFTREELAAALDAARRRGPPEYPVKGE